MEPKKFTQFGTFSVITIGSISILCLVLMFVIGIKDMFFIGTMGIVLLILLITLSIFYKLTITIDETYLRFSLGSGLISKKYLISDIESCKPVRNNPIYGVGIRKIPKGWLYSVTGLEAIEIKLKGSKRIVRIGTKHSREITEIISGMMNIDQTGDELEYKNKIGYLLAATIMGLTLIFILTLFLYGNKETKITLERSGIKIDGMYGMTINYSDIQQIDTISAFPHIKLKTNGYAAGKILKGNFMLQNNEKVKLFINKGVPPYILIRTINQDVYLNFKNPQQTIDLFNIIIAKQ